jgi:hypothetical protein
MTLTVQRLWQADGFYAHVISTLPRVSLLSFVRGNKVDASRTIFFSI